MILTQEDYDTILFLVRAVYSNMIYPSPFKCVAQISLDEDGLKLNIFDMGSYDLFVFCGSNSKRDWVANFKVGLGIVPFQYQQALYEVRLRDATNKDKPMVFCGHSLGGGLAEYCACHPYNNDIFCITFNGCGVKHIVPPVYRSESRILNLVAEHDLLNGITERIPHHSYLQHVGKVVVLEDEYKIICADGHRDFKVFKNYKMQEVIK